METLLNGEHNDGVVVLIDDLPLRRAELAAFLLEWAQQMQMQMIESDLTASEHGDVIDGLNHIRMMIISLGGDPLLRSRALSFMVRQDRVGHGIPIVVFSDRSAKRDVQIAFQAGARGYIPSTTEPALALQALTFILNGGHYFPSMTL